MESEHQTIKFSEKNQNDINQDLKQENNEAKNYLTNLLKEFEATRQFIDESSHSLSLYESWLEESKSFFEILISKATSLENLHKTRVKKLKRAREVKRKEGVRLVNEMLAKKALNNK